MCFLLVSSPFFFFLSFLQGLPVLTVHGDSFPNRVGLSLFRSFPKSSTVISQPFDTYLVANDVKEFIEMAVRLTHPLKDELLSSVWFLKLQLIEWIIKEKGLFDSISHIEKLKRSVTSLIEGYQVDLKHLSLYHLIELEETERSING
jgi:predicted O-linked N-acetylglucosamine transferase (SPINDLY family)